MRVLVCGGRNYRDRTSVFSTLDALAGVSTIIHGAARGADALGAEWAAARGISVTAFPARWAQYGNRAGYIRNQQMLDEGRPDLVVAFPGARGTADMVKRARLRGVSVQEAP